MTSVDKAQWIDVYRRLEKPLYNVVYRVIWDATESQDVVQETFLRCWRRKEDIRADGFKALLFRTALNLASNRRRRTRLWRVVGVEVLGEVADENASPHAFSKSMRASAGASTACNIFICARRARVRWCRSLRSRESSHLQPAR